MSTSKEKFATIKYRDNNHQKQISEGVMDDSGPAVQIEKYSIKKSKRKKEKNELHNQNLENFKSSMNISNTNHLREYFCNTSDDGGEFLYEPFDKTLHAWLLDEVTMKGNFVFTYKQFPNMKQGAFLKEEYKQVIKSMVVFIQTVHGTQQCLSDFNENNVVMWNGEAKFWHIQLVPLTVDQVRHNYSSLSNLIRSVFFNNLFSPLPDDIVHFLKLLENGRSKQAYRIRNHVALMSNKKLKCFINDCWKQSGNMATRQRYYNAARKLGYGSKNHWSQLIDVDSPLYEVFTGRRKPYDVIDNLELIHFIRNAGEHLVDKSKKCTIFSIDDDVRIIMTGLSKVLADFQKNLDDEGLLEMFWLDSY